MEEQRIRGLESFFFEQMSLKGLPGLAYALIENGEVAYQHALGFRDISQHLPVTLDTLFGIGSVTKMFTAVAIMQLRERGLLDLNDPVEEHVPLPLTSLDAPIRIWHLLSHSSGIPTLGEAEARHSARWFRMGFPIAHARDVLTYMEGADEWIHFPPGERWFYLNEGYLLLGAIIERLSGQSYADYINTHILGPLGMRRSFFLRDQVEEDPDHAIPYCVDRAGQYFVGMNLYRGLPAAGGLITTVKDLAAFTRLFVNEGRSAEAEAIISRDSLGSMMEPRVALPANAAPESVPLGHEDDEFTGERRGAHGCGPQVFPGFFGHTLVGHSGGVMGASAYMGFLPERRMGAVVLTNFNNVAVDQLVLAALATLLGEEITSLPSVRRERLLNGLAGPYDTFRSSIDVEVRRAGELLELVIRNQYQDRVIPLVPTSFDERRPQFLGLSGGLSFPAEFIRSERGVDLLFERYTFRKR